MLNSKNRKRAMRNSARKLTVLLAVMALVIAGAGCSDDDDDPVGVPDVGFGASLRVVHASPNAPAVTPRITALSPGQSPPAVNTPITGMGHSCLGAER